MTPRWVNDIVRANALLTPEGVAWLDELDDLVTAIEADWGITVGDTMTGGTAGYVAEAVQSDGRLCVLKLAPPQAQYNGPFETEVDVLVAARGRGYVDVYAHDKSRRALLLERLGAQMADNGESVDSWVATLGAMVQGTWSAGIEPPTSLITGAQKAAWLAESVEASWVRAGEPCARAVIDEAIRFCEARIAAHDPSTAVLVHGDAHAWNALAAPGGGYKLIDPDPFVAEPAADLSVPMREWNGELLAGGDPVGATQARVALLHDVTGVDPTAIWQWGYVERVSTAMVCMFDALIDWATDAFAVAEACVGAGPA